MTKKITLDTVVANPPFSLDKWGKVEDKEENKVSNGFDPETDKYNRFWRGIGCLFERIDELTISLV